MKSRIKELFESNESVYFFDIDGVLAIMEFGEFNHFGLSDEEWIKRIKEEDLYSNVRPNKVIKKFLSDKDMSRIYVITKSANLYEFEYKKKFVSNNFGIACDNIFMVNRDEEKLNVMNKVRNKYADLEDKYFIMVDDSVKVLNNIKDNSSYSTVHVSSFFE